MKNRNLKPLLCLLAAFCIFLAGCNRTNGGDASPVDTDTAQSDQFQLEYSDITGTWELSDSNNDMVYYLTFENGEVSYVAYSARLDESVEGGGSCTITEDGKAIISVSLLDEVLENTYNVMISGDTLTLTLAGGETADEDSYSLAGTYVKSELPENPAPTGQVTDAEAEETGTTASDNTAATDSSSTKDEETASFLANTRFLAGSDTFLGNTYENEVTGSFILSDADRIEGTFYVSISQSSIGSVNFYIEGNTIYFSNSTMGTYSKCTFVVSDTYIKIQQNESDATGEDLLNTIEGTWYAN